MRRNIPFIAAIAAMLLLQGCQTSRSSPITGEFRDAAKDHQIFIEKLDAPLELTSANIPDEDESMTSLSAQTFNAELLLAGDVLDVTIIETPATPNTPMLLPAPLQLPAVEIPEDEQISIPYAGLISTSGQTVADIRTELTSRLRSKIYQPQVVVHRNVRRSATVTVFGSVAQGGALPIDGSMTTLAGLVGQARPQVRNVENSRIILQRGGTVHTVALSELYEDSRNDIALVPGDLVTVREDAGFVSIIGAVGLQGRIEIIGADFSIVDAIVSARGLAANFADPEGVFLLRRDPAASEGLRIFEINLSDPVAISAAAQSPVLDDDVLVASTASFARTRQILSLASQSIGVTANISRIAQ